MSSQRIIYSTNVLLAYKICKFYYNDLHYVWCTPDFGSPSSGVLTCNPPSSQALYRYNCLQTAVKGGDLHSASITEQRTGLTHGTQTKYDKGVITKEQRDDILYAIEKSPITEFRPLIYAIPYADVKHLLKPVPIADRARPTSLEYIIEELPGAMFDILYWDT